MNLDKHDSSLHICICICTFKRPQTLKILLDKLKNLNASGIFTYSINIVDNDVNCSAAKTVEQFESSSKIPIRYQVEPRQNISLARNMAVATAKGDYFAFIDDDEFPTETWLTTLYVMIQQYQVAGVLGPVLPYFDKETPSWLIRSGICTRTSLPTGTFLTLKRTRTGNVLFDSRVFEGAISPFEPDKGRRGGEDVAFFRNMIEKGNQFVWCEEAPVYEIVGPKRWSRMYYFKRSVINGGNSGSMMREKPFSSLPLLLRSAISFPILLILLPFSLVIGQHVFMPYLCSASYHISRICSFMGLIVIKERND
jgi:glycosyltransferase involved in cell wall biosynthesis